MPNPNQILLLEENTECFLQKGILCLGPITREGCEHRCIELGLPCEGCMGPIAKDYTSNVVNFLSLLNLSHELEDYNGIYYRFSKPKFKEVK
jgi:F420-non-reducing hydrogenase small subunit